MAIRFDGARGTGVLTKLAQIDVIVSDARKLIEKRDFSGAGLYLQTVINISNDLMSTLTQLHEEEMKRKYPERW